MNQRDKYLLKQIGQAFLIVLILFVFMFSIDLMVISLGHISKDAVRSMISLVSNPFIALFIGLLITSIVQSSSTTTSVIVAMVASGSMEISHAIPMVMGANIGTTITSDLVSLSFIAKKVELRRAITTSTSHDFFNILTTIILLPLQYFYNIIGRISETITSFLNINLAHNAYPNTPVSSASLVNIPVSDQFFNLIDSPIITFILSLVLLFVSIKLLAKIISSLFLGSSRSKFESFIFKNTYKSFTWGAILTGAVQSSSVTTSLLVPIVAVGRIKVKNAFPFILGANVGTTLTALLAALFKNEAAISIAIAHLSFNLIGVLIFLPIRFMRNIPVFLANQLGLLTSKHRIVGFLYIIITFFLLPFALIFISK